MFALLATRLRREIDEVKNVVVWHEALRNAINAPPAATTPDLPIDAATIATLRGRAPSKLAWQIFDHYAAVSRIYALFERSVCDLVTDYLAILPSVTTTYDKLHDRVRQQHRIGVGQVLTKWSSTNPLYSALAERDIAAGLADALRGLSYSLLPDAFLLSPENFRPGAIVRLFADLGFDNAFAFVSKSPSVDEFLRVRLAGAETAESFLDGFVRIRNEAAHGSGSSLVSAKEIVNYGDFTVLVVDALAAVLRSHALRLGVATGRCIEIGDVVHVFSENIVGVRASATEALNVGDRLYGGKKTLEPVGIVSLRLIDVDHVSLAVSPGVEFGAKLDRKLAIGSRIFRWKPSS